MAAAATLCLSSLPAAGQSRGITPEDYFAFKTVNDVQLSPDGSMIAFVVGTVDQKQNRRYSAIWTIPADGSREPVLLTTAVQSSTNPRWSPDGRVVAFLSARPVPGEPAADAPRTQIWLLRFDGGEARRVTNLPNGVTSIAWSPDGTQIIFSSSMQGNPELYVSDINGGRPKRLTNANGASMSPSWNPKTGQTIAFVSDRGGTPQLYLMNSDGTSATKLDVPDKGYVIDPAWAPNGQLLAFSWRRPNDNYDIYIMDAATRQIVELTRDQGRNERPSWAPDGRHLVFESTRGGTRQIWTMLADGSQPHQLTTSGHNESPNWSPK